MNLELYTDGSGTPSGPMGWAWVLIDRSNEVLNEHSGSEPEGTANIAEMLAVIKGLRYCKQRHPKANITIKSDSAYVVNAFKDNWFRGWKKRRWKNARGRPVANKELWLQMKDLANQLNVTFEHIPGHCGIEHNETCDRLAGEARLKCIAELEECLNTENLYG